MDDAMKRKAEKQKASVPRSAVSAVAARRARQQQQDNAPVRDREVEPPAKRLRSSPDNSPDDVVSLDRERATIDLLPTEDTAFELNNTDAVNIPEHDLSENGEAIVDEKEDVDDADRVDVSRLAAASENFTLSRHRLRKSDIVYSDERMLCVRLREKTTLVLIGIYDIWVKRGVISLMGAKLHPSTKTHRVYAPSTHSLPVIKCVSGVEGYAEIEIQSCSSNLHRLKNLSPYYSRIWNSTKTAGDGITLSGPYKRSFSILYTSSDDPLNRPLRPLHLEKKWSTTIKSLSQRAHSLRILVCGPKGAGKSTFGRYLLNHLLTPAPQIDGGGSPSLDGVAFLDLDPGQPEFAPMGNIYLAHLREPCFGPPFSHPNLNNSSYGKIIRCHHIGATSPKEDPDNYAMAIMNLLDQHAALLATYPRCPLIINFPGWIFGLGLEVATWLIRTAGLSDVVYMSEKGPDEVVEPLRHAAIDAAVALTTLPSQPVDAVTRSSAQLRSMQMQSYFHMRWPEGLYNPSWSDSPLVHNRPVCVSYGGSQSGIAGIMVLGNHYSPQVLRDIIEGSVVAVVAVENSSTSRRNSVIEADPDSESHGEEEQTDVMIDAMSDNDLDVNENVKSADAEDNQTMNDTLHNNVTRCPDTGLPYLFIGAGCNTPLDPKESHSLGLAFIRSVDVSSQKLELISPIPSASIREAIVNQGQSLVLVRGMIDSPDWAFSEEYHAARNAEQDYIVTISQGRKKNDSGVDQKGKQTNGDGDDDSDDRRQQQNENLRRLQDRVRRASHMPYLNVIEEASALHAHENRQEAGTWRLRKRVYISSDSELD